MVKVIAGIYKGRNLNTPDVNTKPTKGSVKEAIFSSLTYKLKDEGSKEVYNSDIIIKDGYFNDPNDSDSDYKKASEYTSGFSTYNDLELVKYYKYSGPTNLWLDVGLHKDYD